MIPLPNLPTDNLYKFLFFGGITFIIIGIFTFYTQDFSYSEKVVKLKIEIIKTNDNLKNNKNDVDSLKKKILNISEKINNTEFVKNEPSLDEQLKEITELAKNKEYRDYLKFFFENKEEIIPYYKDKLELSNSENKLIIKHRNYMLDKALLLIKKDELKTERRKLFFLYILSITISLTGVSLAIFGLIKWNIFQKILDNKLLLEIKQLNNR